MPAGKGLYSRLQTVIDLNEIGGTPLKSLPHDLKFVRDLIEHEGPLLSEFQNERGESYLYYWVDCDDDSNRWIVARVSKPGLYSYLVGDEPLRTLIASPLDRFVYLTDIDSNGNPKATWLLFANQIPHKYLPGFESFFVDVAQSASGIQEVYLGKAWAYADLVLYPRRYLQAYYFNAIFSKSSQGSPIWNDYRLKGGYAFHWLFEKIKAFAPKEYEASMDAIGFASPGFVRFKVHPNVSEAVRSSLVAYMRKSDEIAPRATVLRRWANDKEGVPDDVLAATIVEIANALHVDGQRIIDQSDSLINAAKMLSSYVRKLEFLAKYQESGEAKLVGLPHRSAN